MTGWVAGLLALAAASSPELITAGDLEPQEQVRSEATRAWEWYEAKFLQVTRVPAGAFHGSIAIHQGAVPRGRGGVSGPGEVWLRQARPYSLSERELETLRHEIAHQFLFAACPQASGDRMFHEAFALSVSGELGRWTEDEYSGLSASLKELSQPRVDLDSRSGRRALARLLVESQAPGAVLPRALEAPLKRCADGLAWERVRPGDLVGRSGAPADAFVAIHRASGEVVLSQGDVQSALPYGSTLKPFVVAGANAEPPVLSRRGTPEWLCGDALPASIGVDRALPLSCNGYFLDWGARVPQVARMGDWGAVLVAAGLGRPPLDMPEAIGLRSTLSLSPLGLARAYRVLAEARPDVMRLLKETPRDGTLSGLEASRELEGLSLKTGTVRDPESRPRYGWIVGVSDTLVAVMVRSGRQPRSFAGDFARMLERAARAGGEGAVKVQVLGLLEPGQVQARCDGAGFALAGAGAGRALFPNAVPPGFFGLRDVAARGRVMCLGGPFLVRFPRVQPAEGREYAGTFVLSEPPPYRAPDGVPVPERARRARRGSDLVFETSRSLYAAGVVQAEDAAIGGEARAALLKVVDSNGQHSRHPGRPVCDTTHCQVFLGTVAPKPGDRAALERPFGARDWLLFSRGGDDAWREARPLRDVERVLGGPFASLEMKGGQVVVTRNQARGEAIWDEAERSACEVLRGPLKLPSCPSAARRDGATVVFEGRGRGHGLGLDVEWAKASGLPADELLRRAYGAGP